ncbi:hypothetical protein O0L34_g16065 [Tuta absoluta]|nr:hypothetical protein O0L34_g16065 [Tuta absoluta]
MDRIRALELDIAAIRKTLAVKEKQLYELKKEWISATNTISEDPLAAGEPHAVSTGFQRLEKLPKWAIERYSRQILLPDIGVRGQEKLCSAKVLVVGAGGLGCPAALYLAGAGVGEIGIVDYDTVDVTNLHRQVLHGERDQNMDKVASAANALRNINSRITITPYNCQLDASNALEIVSKHDIVLDCTDNVPTRYLLNDACVLAKLPLISGSALKLEGQITIYGYRAENNPEEKEKSYLGPCYRCVFPTPPPAETVGSCSANGVAGPVPGLIGAMQALEAIKYIVGHTHDKLLVGRMTLFDGEDTTFTNVRLRPQNPECPACSKSPTITKLIDYETFCKAQAKEKDLDLKILPPENRIAAPELANKLSNREDTRHLLIDVRSEAEFNMCSIEGAVNYPLDKLLTSYVAEEVTNGREVTFVCRRGNDSQLAAQKVLDQLEEPYRQHVKDLTGGLHAWAKLVDEDFPVY